MDIPTTIILGMTYEQAIRRFRTQERLAAALGITQPTVSAWRRVVPPRYQYQLHVLTNGELKVDKNLLAGAWLGREA